MLKIKIHMKCIEICTGDLTAYQYTMLKERIIVNFKEGYVINQDKIIVDSKKKYLYELLYLLSLDFDIELM